MLSRIRTRHSSQSIIPTRRPFWHGRLFVAIFVSLFVVALAITGQLDEKSDASVLRAASAVRDKAALARLHPQVLAAYEAGMADALESVKETPDGVALAQACLALRGGL